MSKFVAILPARMQSTRLADKMLLDLAGMPLIVRTALQAKKSKATRVIVATDHADIQKACRDHGIETAMTSDKHISGTDRLAEVVSQLQLEPNDIVLNVQGDEPLIDPQLIDDLADFIFAKQTPMATIAHKIVDSGEILNPNVVKVVLDAVQNALYFSRSPIPFYRDGFSDSNNFKLPQNVNILRHVGLYAYSTSFLLEYTKLPKCEIESVEHLEQLRVIYHGYKIAVLESAIIPKHGIDTQEDLERARLHLTQNP